MHTNTLNFLKSAVALLFGLMGSAFGTIIQVPADQRGLMRPQTETLYWFLQAHTLRTSTSLAKL